ncbi:MAG: hypothetical protein A4E55_01198 [Pelotomaculum sp. PtaU1.Bin035]|nr:MAG: hypothetical protein A4E55_01198 [Pelotomaculum sp. PtaU1.Bin035]
MKRTKVERTPEEITAERGARLGKADSKKNKKRGVINDRLAELPVNTER